MGRLKDAGIDLSVGSKGDSHDDALAETIIGLYETELIRREGPWRNLEDVELATLEWVSWFTGKRPWQLLPFPCPEAAPREPEENLLRLNAGADHIVYSPVMDADRYSRLKRIFFEASSREVDEREAFIDEACRDDPELRSQVHDLLQTAGPLTPHLARSDLPSVEAIGAGDRIGPYNLLEKIGEGGMGTVWRARQETPVRREVAVKLLRAGIETADALARFEAERQALALMDHPCIAKVYEAGTTKGGRPFFAMEYIRGEPITEYCDRRRLTLRERLALFLRTCDGVRHAHQKAIIHRDLKPSNILVTVLDDLAVPKIIDFGVAKAMAHRLTDRTMVTYLGQLIGTPEYMSPEQAEMGGADVDTRTDVYALGVILYELLSGSLPFDSKTLREGGFEGVRRLIREVDPLRPSERLGSMGQQQTDHVAAARATEPVMLLGAVRGDLDWIVMKALEKDPVRRYESPSQLAADIQRHLEDEPVVARPPSTAYRMSKFLRRHRVTVSVAALVVGLLVVFAVTMAFQAARIARERDRANVQTAVARETTDFLVDLFRVADPAESRGEEVTARELLDRGSARLYDEIQDPAVRAELTGEIGLIYQNLGHYPEAGRLLGDAAALHAETFGPDDPRTLAALDDLAGLEDDAGRFAVAESLYLAVLDGWRRIGGEEDERYLDTRHGLALVHKSQDRMEEAEEGFQSVLETLRRLGREDEPAALAALANLATVHLRTGKPGEAEPLLKEVLARRRRLLGDDHPSTLGTMARLGSLYREIGRHDEAVEILRETANAQRRVLGTRHPDYSITLEYLANVHAARENWEEAAGAYTAILELRRDELGPEHPNTLISMHNLSSALAMTGRRAEAESLATLTWETRRRVIGESHEHTLGTLYSLSVLAAMREDREEAVEWLGEAVRLGYARPSILTNEEFKRFRGDPEFEALREEVRRRLED